MTRTVNYTYDSLNRMTKQSLPFTGGTYDMSYTYVAGATHAGVTPNNATPTTSLVAGIHQYRGAGKPEQRHTYEYDPMGNIEKETYTTGTVPNTTTVERKYKYDGLGQLLEADDGEYKLKWTMTYDAHGNIASMKKEDTTNPASPVVKETKTYTYRQTGWRDQLETLKVNTAEQSFSYDAIGNLTGDGKWTYTWSGRRLESMARVGTGERVAYGYGDDGLRRSKRRYTEQTTGGQTTQTPISDTTYLYNGGKLVGLRHTEGTTTHTIYYHYGADGRAYALTYNGAQYLLVYNLQGDVTGIADMNATTVVQYDYGPWGEMLPILGGMKDTLGKVNPIRYRGYVWDEETGLYYLQSRYYSPSILRYISADVVLERNKTYFGMNLHSYCGNNPIVFLDKNGLRRSPVEDDNDDAVLNGRARECDDELDLFLLGQKIDMGEFFYRIDKGPNSDHVHVWKKGKEGSEWKQKSNGDPYEPNHKTTVPGDPPKKWRDKMRNGDKNGNNKWDWDGNKAKKDAREKSEKTIDLAEVAGGAVALYLVYLAVKGAIAIAGAPVTGGASLGLFALP